MQTQSVILNESKPERPTSARRYARRLEGGKRLNLIQARLNDGEREQYDRVKAVTGLNDSALIREALAQFAVARVGNESGKSEG